MSWVMVVEAGMQDARARSRSEARGWVVVIEAGTAEQDAVVVWWDWPRRIARCGRSWVCDVVDFCRYL